MAKNRQDGICPKCGVNPKPRRPEGGYRGWCRQCESAQKAEYQRTDKGKETTRRYLQTDKGKATRRESVKQWYDRTRETEEGREKLRAWSRRDYAKKKRRADGAS